MGMYDTVLVPCPNCGELYDAQSKSGECLLRVFSFDECPSDVMENVNRHSPFVCSCGTRFKVEFTPKPTIVKTEEINDDFPQISEKMNIDYFVREFVEYQNRLDKK